MFALYYLGRLVESNQLSVPEESNLSVELSLKTFRGGKNRLNVARRKTRAEYVHFIPVKIRRISDGEFARTIEVTLFSDRLAHSVIERR